MTRLFLLLLLSCKAAQGRGPLAEGFEASEGGWRSVAAGTRASCGVPAEGTVVCWGNELVEGDTGWIDPGDADAPALTGVTYVALSVTGRDGTGGGAACAIVDDGTARCWGDIRFEPAPNADRRYTDIRVTDPGFVTVASDDPRYYEAMDWSQSGANRIDWTGHPYRLRASRDTWCLTNAENGKTNCRMAGEELPRDWKVGGPSGAYWAIEPMGASLCGLELGGAITCWNPDDESPSTEIEAPTGGTPYRDFCVSNDWGWGCAIDADGHPDCFGVPGGDPARWPWTLPPPEDTVFTSISCGAHHACGLTSAGDVECFGNDTYGQATPPAERTSHG